MESHLPTPTVGTHEEKAAKLCTMSEGWIQRWTRSLGRARRAIFAPQNPLDVGLQTLNERLGRANANEHRLHALPCTVKETRRCTRGLCYAPDMDGQVDPGEVVWFWAPNDEGGRTSERAIVVVGREEDHVLGLITSPNPDHAAEPSWLDIGSGPWDASGRQSWVRLDRLVVVPESAIRRQGAVMPQRRFDRIAQRLRTEYGWS